MLRKVRSRPRLYLISDKLNFGLGIVDWSLNTGHITLKDIYHKERMNLFPYTPVKFNYLRFLAKTFIFSAKKASKISKHS